MGLTKKEIFTKQQNELAEIAKVLGHPARIAIVQQIIQHQSCICGDLVDEIGLAQATISQHLRELKKVGIIQGTVEGTSVCYCLNPEKWMGLAKTFSSFISGVSKSLNNCC